MAGMPAENTNAFHLPSSHICRDKNIKCEALRREWLAEEIDGRQKLVGKF